jgi:hypothetical protein
MNWEYKNLFLLLNHKYYFSGGPRKWSAQMVRANGPRKWSAQMVRANGPRMMFY